MNAALLTVLERQMKDTKRAYYANMPGVTYDDMSAATRRFLEMRRAYEKATGRPVKTRITQRAIADMLR